MHIREAEKNDLTAIIQLLEMGNLPTEDCAEQIGAFILAEENKRTVAVGGLEVHGQEGLLRSIAVVPDRRGSGVGRMICSELGARAAKSGVERLFLLTESAAPYFLALGFEMVQRKDAPAAIQATRQYRGLCPITATVMFRAVKSASERGRP